MYQLLKNIFMNNYKQIELLTLYLQNYPILDWVGLDHYILTSKIYSSTISAPFKATLYKVNINSLDCKEQRNKLYQWFILSYPFGNIQNKMGNS